MPGLRALAPRQPMPSIASIAGASSRSRTRARCRQTYQLPKPSQKARALAKKPSDSGELLRASFSNSLQQLALAPRQVDRRFDGNLDIHVAHLAERSTGMPLPLSRNCLPVWVPSGIDDARLLAVDGRHLDFAAQRARRSSRSAPCRTDRRRRAGRIHAAER